MKKLLPLVLVIFMANTTLTFGQTNLLPSSGNVGIGTITPQSKLDVVGGLTVDEGQASGVRFSRSYDVHGHIYVDQQQGYLLNYKGHYGHKFQTSIGEVFRITSSGNVGIGTTNPENSENWNKVLDVYGSAHSKILATTAEVHTGMWSHNTGFFNAPPGGIIGTKSNHPLSLVTSGNNRLTINITGNVGIGTTNPAVKLDVQGGINFNNQIYNQNKLNYQGYEGSPTNGQNKMAVALYSIGKKLYMDETFKKGNNNIGVYDNNGSGKVTITRISAPVGTPNNSGYVLEIKHTDNTATPGYGGFYFSNQTRANATFACIFKAKLPAGYVLNFASNAFGNEGKNFWATDNIGTGKWEDYVYIVKCGISGNLHTTNYFYVTEGVAPSSGSPLIWHLSSSTVYDCDDRDNSEVSTQLSDINGYKTFFTNPFSTTTTQPKRFEIARIFTDLTNWSSTSPVEIELLETSYASGASRKYRVHFGYLNKDGVINQVEVSDITASSGAAGINNFQLAIGTPVTDGNLKYLPIYADVRYYTTLRALIKTARPTTPNKTGGVTGTIYVNSEPAGTDILEFVPNNNTEFATAGGNSIFNGSVGIGTKTPDANFKLHIKGIHGNTSTLLQLPASANGANTGEVTLNTWVSEPNISWEGTGIGANINNWGLTRFNTGLSSSYIRFIPQPTNGVMQFATIAGNGKKYDNVMTLVNDNVGIGTGAPIEKLSVLHNGSNTPFGAMGIDVTSFSTASNAADSYYFRVRDIGAGNNIPFIIKGTGSVGIGTTTPISSLQTNGTVTIGSGTNPSAVGVMQLKTEIVSPIANRLTYGTDGSGWKFAIGKNQGGTVTDQFVIQDNGNVSIGTTTAPVGYKLAIAGDMIAERVVVKLQANWPDYVFKTGYSLRPLSEVENFVKANNHLPDVPSEAEIKAKGIDIEQMNATLLKKVEELTLYMIELQKQNDVLKKRMDSLDKK